MHHFIYPLADTYITNRSRMNDKNYGIDEILQVGTTNAYVRTLNYTKPYIYTNVTYSNQRMTDYTGIFSGSMLGTYTNVQGSISGSQLLFTSSYFSGSINNISQITSGSISGSLVNGIISGSLMADTVFGTFIGELTSSNVCLTGYGSGIDIKNEQNWSTNVTQYCDRTLIKFDLSLISQSISSGDISNPKFELKLYISDECDLPIEYTVYALPVSQSWNMGDGYLSDGGSNTGVSWKYKDNNYGTTWYTASVTGVKPAIDFVSNPTLATASFGYGGGTWWTGSVVSQSFNYKTSDITMDVTPIVMSWISGSIPNEGFILLHSDELQATGSGFILKFFSRDTNTVYSPYLDVKWKDYTFSTSSVFTSSIQSYTIDSGITASIQSGSTFHIKGGVSGSFSGSTFITIVDNYITASNNIFEYQLVENFIGNFTGSFVGTASFVNGTLSGSNLIFNTTYFSGSIDGTGSLYSGSLSGSIIDGTLSGSMYCDIPNGIFTGTITSSLITLNGTGSGTFLDPSFLSFSGFLSCIGTTGNISGSPVIGNAYGLISKNTTNVALPNNIVVLYPTSPNEAPYVSGYQIENPSSPYNALINYFYYWNGEFWNSPLGLLPAAPFTCSCGPTYDSQTMVGTFTNGVFSGSHFVAYYYNYGILLGTLSGSLTENALLGSKVDIRIPSGIDPYAYAVVNGPYVHGTALGLYNIYDNTSASFSGQFINDILIGGYINMQLSGSVYTSSFTTSIINVSSSKLNVLDISQPFSIGLQNVQPAYKMGDMVKMNVFGRKKFPLKTFGLATQQEQYLIPECLPSASYYAIRDYQSNELLMPVDEYTQLSCQYPEGSYFVLDTTGLPQERFYKVLIQTSNGTETYTIDTGKTFKIVR